MTGTVGAGGHAAAILEQIGPTGHLIGFDRDPMMLQFAAQKLANLPVTLIHGSYATAFEALSHRGIGKVDRVLLDLGLSSDQLADRTRGFSIESEGPLDMRFDDTQGEPVAAWLSKVKRADLVSALKDFGEEPQAERIADQILAARSGSPFTAKQLAEIVETATGFRVSGRRTGGTHPATRTFQALRIVANRELEEVERMLLTVIPQILVAGGRAAVISFHSLEDRLVKQAFRSKSVWQDQTPKPIACSPSEERINPRARTAKLRVAVLAATSN